MRKLVVVFILALLFPTLIAGQEDDIDDAEDILEMESFELNEKFDLQWLSDAAKSDAVRQRWNELRLEHKVEVFESRYIGNFREEFAQYAIQTYSLG
ncbi:hypothetical protein HYS48_00130, partial [Candidatus Woesearchaeota archaeon]|nr:hypothetical protein [Candidatus Woesearchaeota archaeon]